MRHLDSRRSRFGHRLRADRDDPRRGAGESACHSDREAARGAGESAFRWACEEALRDQLLSWPRLEPRRMTPRPPQRERRQLGREFPERPAAPGLRAAPGSRPRGAVPQPEASEFRRGVRPRQAAGPAEVPERVEEQPWGAGSMAAGRAGRPCEPGPQVSMTRPSAQASGPAAASRLPAGRRARRVLARAPWPARWAWVRPSSRPSPARVPAARVLAPVLVLVRGPGPHGGPFDAIDRLGARRCLRSDSSLRCPEHRKDRGSPDWTSPVLLRVHRHGLLLARKTHPRGSMDCARSMAVRGRG